jgi:hypothetical protein
MQRRHLVAMDGTKVMGSNSDLMSNLQERGWTALCWQLARTTALREKSSREFLIPSDTYPSYPTKQAR